MLTTDSNPLTPNTKTYSEAVQIILEQAAIAAGSKRQKGTQNNKTDQYFIGCSQPKN